VIVGVFKSGLDLPLFFQCPQTACFICQGVKTACCVGFLRVTAWWNIKIQSMFTHALHKYSMYSMLKTNTACLHMLFTNKARWIHFTYTACWIYIANTACWICIANTACWMHCTNTACWIYTACWNIRIYSMLNCHIHIIQHVETSSHTACWLAHYLTSMLNAYVCPDHVPIIQLYGWNQNLVAVWSKDPQYKNFVTGILQVFVEKSNKIGRLWTVIYLVSRSLPTREWSGVRRLVKMTSVRVADFCAYIQ
jgi:uncharacterized protein Usg